MRVENGSYMYRPTCRRLVWICLSRSLTFFIPNFILHHVGGLKTSASRQAWREKVLLFFSFLFSAAFLCFWLEYVSSLFCDPEKAYDYDYVFSNESKYSAINGKAVNWHHYSGPPNPIIDYVNQYPHYDLSPNFPRFLMLNRTSDSSAYDNEISNDCIYSQEKDVEADAFLDYLIKTQPGYTFVNDALTYCPIPGHSNVTGAPCFYGAEVEHLVNTLPVKGDIKYDPNEIAKLHNSLPTPGNTTKQAYVILDGYVLDVTMYLTVVTNIVPLSATMSSRSFSAERMFLPMDLTLFLYINLGKDITDSFAGNVSNSDLYRHCLVDLFQKGVVPSHIPDGCARINPALWATMGVGLLYFLTKMSLAYLSRIPFIQRRLFSGAPELSALYRSSSHIVQPYTILMIPCFSESSDILKLTLDSLSRTAYEDSKKLLLFVCDGITTSALEEKETHVLLLENLGYSGTDEPLPQQYTSLGQGRKQLNYAKVYSGFYETGRNRVPYVVIVKVGQPYEMNVFEGIAPPGNRGKRDSLMIVFGFLERCMNLANNQIAPLDYEVFNQCYNVLGVDPRNFKYILVTDADIQVQDDVVQKLISRLEEDHKMLAVSGHVRPANPEDNLTTMLQIFPVYMSFFSGLAYEACLGSVMTIQGGLVMYKVWTENVPHSTQQQSEKLQKNRKLLQQHSDSTSQRHSSSEASGTNRHGQYSNGTKWPKLSDEIIVVNPFSDPVQSRRISSTDTILTATTTTTTNTSATHLHSHRKQQQREQQGRGRWPESQHQGGSRPGSRLSLAARVNIRACCVHPTVLRGIATPQANTMHMQNVLLLGEEKLMPVVLLRSHPGHRLGFEPDAVGYATLPTNFFSLQGLQTRNIRAAFHTQLEMQRVSWQLGFTYWILSTTEILDMIFSMPVIIYLYGIFGRSVRSRALAYTIIVFAFTSLVALHVLFFLFRRQFRYIVWFILYCLLSLPLFAIWFPLLSIWQSDYASYWYDVWPTKKNNASYFTTRSRVHGILDYADETHNKEERRHSDADDANQKEEKDDSMVVSRLRLGEYEVLEARRAEAALDSKFIGFTGFTDDKDGGKHHVAPSPTTYTSDIASPPVAQIREGVHSTRIMTSYTPFAGEYGTTARRHYPNERPSSLLNPFNDPIEANPFDDENQIQITVTKEHLENSDIPYSTGSRHRYLQHRPSHSQSSYFTTTTQDELTVPTTYSTKGGIFMGHVNDNNTDGSTLSSSLSSSGFAKLPVYSDGYQHKDVMMMDMSNTAKSSHLLDNREDGSNIPFDRASTTLSIASKTFSIITHDNIHSISDDDYEDDRETRTNRLPRHQRLLDSLRQNNDTQRTSEAPVPEEGRRVALHNLNINNNHSNLSTHHPSNANLRQQYDNHANVNDILPTKPAATPRRLLTKNAISSSNSLSHHYRNMSNSNNSHALSLRTQPSRANMNLITNDMSLPEVQQVIKAEIRYYLQRADLESTTRAQVKAHLLRHFGESRINEDDEQMMNYIALCIEEITIELCK